MPPSFKSLTGISSVPSQSCMVERHCNTTLLKADLKPMIQGELQPFMPFRPGSYFPSSFRGSSAIFLLSSSGL